MFATFPPWTYKPAHTHCSGFWKCCILSVKSRPYSMLVAWWRWKRRSVHFLMAQTICLLRGFFIFFLFFFYRSVYLTYLPTNLPLWVSRTSPGRPCFQSAEAGRWVGYLWSTYPVHPAVLPSVASALEQSKQSLCMDHTHTCTVYNICISIQADTYNTHT